MLKRVWVSSRRDVFIDFAIAEDGVVDGAIELIETLEIFIIWILKIQGGVPRILRVRWWHVPSSLRQDVAYLLG